MNEMLGNSIPAQMANGNRQTAFPGDRLASIGKESIELRLNLLAFRPS
ncbi:MAG: hypothetical protein HC895_05930 [Leptolyngbyaceae cyanobacterium SM1_3_5]|nr:hypothetical protein [Leptolyngbyaceae cyanobacterium SM1_3_5]